MIARAWSVRRLVRYAVAAACTGFSLGAQSADSLGGIAVDSVGSPVYGALIVARDAKGQPVARAVSGRRGLFMMAMPNADTVSLVGFRTGFLVLAPVVATTAARPASFTLPVASRRMAGSTWNANQKSVCGAPSDASLDVTRLWQAVRIVLESTRWPFGREEVLRKISQFDRTLTTDGKVLSTSVERVREGVVGPPFVSLPADSIAKVGYVVESANDVSYYAPDAAVMLAPSFADQLCFSVVVVAERPDLVGLAFKPKANRGSIKDIGGIFWLSKESLELQRLEYRYTNVPQAYVAARVGGELTFTLMPVGAWIISRWEIRMPQGAIQKQIAMQHSITRERTQVTVESVLATIGEIRNVRVGGDSFTLPSPRP